MTKFTMASFVLMLMLFFAAGCKIAIATPPKPMTPEALSHQSSGGINNFKPIAENPGPKCCNENKSFGKCTPNKDDDRCSHFCQSSCRGGFCKKFGSGSLCHCYC